VGRQRKTAADRWEAGPQLARLVQMTVGTMQTEPPPGRTPRRRRA